MSINAGISGLRGPKCAGDHRPHVRRGNRLRRRITGMPVELMPRVENESKIADAMRTDQRSSIHQLRDALQPLRNLDVVNGGVDARERAEHRVRCESGFVRRVALRVERFRLRHSARHPKQNHGVGASRGFCGAGNQPCFAARQRRQSSRARSLEENDAGPVLLLFLSRYSFFVIHLNSPAI